jgi:hypothetical protein
VPRKALSCSVMSTRKLILAIGIVAVLGSASLARAQWVRLQRCNGALPCAIPFGVRYDPDPLVAGQYGFVSPNAFSARLDFDLGRPVLHLDTPGPALEPRDFATEAARRFLLAHPPPASKPTPTPEKTTPLSE